MLCLKDKATKFAELVKQYQETEEDVKGSFLYLLEATGELNEVGVTLDAFKQYLLSNSGITSPEPEPEVVPAPIVGNTGENSKPAATVPQEESKSKQLTWAEMELAREQFAYKVQVERLSSIIVSPGKKAWLLGAANTDLVASKFLRYNFVPQYHDDSYIKRLATRTSALYKREYGKDSRIKKGSSAATNNPVNKYPVRLLVECMLQIICEEDF